jgi:hypothetical protein
MVEASAPGTVSLSRAVGTETPRHPPPQRDSGETVAETPDLKVLAQLVIGRDSQRDGARDRVLRPASAVGAQDETVPAADAAALTLGEADEERSAIVQFDGNIPRTWAEGFARLHPDRLPPACRPGSGCASSTISECFSIAPSAPPPRHSDGDHTICSAATATGPLRGSTTSGFCGYLMAGG